MHNHGSGHLFVCAERKNVHDRYTPVSPVGIWNLVDLFGIYFAAVREEQNRIECIGGDKHDDFIFTTHILADNTPSTAMLGAISGDRNAFDVSALGDGDEDGFIGYQIFFS